MRGAIGQHENKGVEVQQMSTSASSEQYVSASGTWRKEDSVILADFKARMAHLGSSTMRVNCVGSAIDLLLRVEGFAHELRPFKSIDSQGQSGTVLQDTGCGGHRHIRSGCDWH